MAKRAATRLVPFAEMTTVLAVEAVVENSVLVMLIAEVLRVSEPLTDLAHVRAFAAPVSAVDASSAPPKVYNCCLFIVLGSP